MYKLYLSENGYTYLGTVKIDKAREYPIEFESFDAAVAHIHTNEYKVWKSSTGIEINLDAPVEPIHPCKNIGVFENKFGEYVPHYFDSTWVTDDRYTGICGPSEDFKIFNAVVEVLSYKGTEIDYPRVGDLMSVIPPYVREGMILELLR